ncbi:hypothetical protein [Sinorhizobium meliloti]|uniref:hypothetical protein n=1 Tax=Rhizobium meliloti TaxID=382 RepID=UPI000FDA45DA|nr:hypothetical protein [Sinorhizobium meliloti]RVP93681.1 hypothetical protein CN069_33875 [Sinorhizobium meliloti]
MTLEENAIGIFELGTYAEASVYCDLLKTERDEVVQSLYDDISPTMTAFDYDEGRTYTVSYNPEDTAINIISTKERYQKMIKKFERKARLFEEAMDTLTDRERDVIRVIYFNHRQHLALSPEYFEEVLSSAREKLCLFLGELKAHQIQAYEENHKESIRQHFARPKAFI